jgi:hypothetical protein
MYVNFVEFENMSEVDALVIADKTISESQFSNVDAVILYENKLNILTAKTVRNISSSVYNGIL